MTENEFLNNLTLIVDSREQTPYLFSGYKTEISGLSIGDYSLKNCETEISVERKSVNDLIGSLTKGRDRFERELQKGAQLPYFAMVIEATLSDLSNSRYKSKALPKSIIQSLLSWSVKYNTHVFFCDSREYAEKVTLSLLLKYARMFYQKYRLLKGG